LEGPDPGRTGRVVMPGDDGRIPGARCAPGFVPFDPAAGGLRAGVADSLLAGRGVTGARTAASPDRYGARNDSR